MQLTEHFSLSEFIKSQDAVRKGIDNSPTAEIVSNLLQLCRNVLEPVRSLGVVQISSGYRCPKLNKAIGGASNSQHQTGEAADFEIAGLSNLFVARWIVKQDLPFDQLILEFYNPLDPNSGWVHVSHSKNSLRKQFLRAFRNKLGKIEYVPME
jgi:zinc D-Ala-D-Ala carboxypeptidase